ncbi:MAG: threonylcarbamoyl-AMP synthase [Gallionella sp.]|jgi:tRNA threonylcarbamoyl adenosine modification protein (Sua5/YciO/YrdC/YwlC family)|nr:threonylcarbamoyl-AMP synthase [Gallionella sp.]
MSQFFTIYPTNINLRLIRQAVEILRGGGIVVYPTDSCYALGCHLDDKEAVTRIRKIRQMDEQHLLTLMCRDLSEISKYARVDNNKFRLLKSNTPGSYTFILEATKEVPKRVQHPKRSTVGIRVPDHPVALALLEELGEPMLSSTLILPDEEWPLNDAGRIRELLEQRVDAVIDGGAAGVDFTTVIDLTGDTPVLLRQGAGDATRFGI